MEQLIKQLLKKYNIKPSKRLGQNFLTNDSVLEKIIAAADLSGSDTVLEIGPGLGVLTTELAKRVGRVVAAEKDKKLCEALQKLLDAGNVRNVKIINEDALKIFNFQFSISNYKLVANLPYYITSPVIKLFLENPPAGGPELMVLMVQKEVAERICAQPGEMSILAVAVQFYGIPEIIAEVKKTSFYPEPKVDSAIIRIIPKKDLPKINTKKFFGLVRAGFSSKRKFLISNLKKRFGVRGSKFEDLFEKSNIDLKSRAENLSVENWLKIYENLEKYIQ